MPAILSNKLALWTSWTVQESPLIVAFIMLSLLFMRLQGAIEPICGLPIWLFIHCYKNVSV